MRSSNNSQPNLAVSRRECLRTALGAASLALVVACGPQAGAPTAPQTSAPSQGQLPSAARQTPAPAATGAPKRGGTLRVGLYVDAATMDPHLSGSKIDRQIYHNVFDPLVVLNTKLEVKPNLAESW